MDWKYRDTQIDFAQEDILYLDKSYFEGVDLIIFPKSLIELDEARLKRIAALSIFSSSDEIFFLNTYVKNGSSVFGINEFELIDLNLMVGGYSLVGNETNRYYTDFDNRLKINYPIYFNSWKNPLENHCNRKCGAGQIDKCRIAQYPMLYKNNMAYNVLQYAKAGS